MKTIYFAWVGSNATCGNPNPKTGRHNMFGDLHIFNNKKARDEFCNTFSHKYNRYPVKTNRKVAKAKYFAGYSQLQFDEYLSFLEIQY